MSKERFLDQCCYSDENCNQQIDPCQFAECGFPVSQHASNSRKQDFNDVKIDVYLKLKT